MCIPFFRRPVRRVDRLDQTPNLGGVACGRLPRSALGDTASDQTFEQPGDVALPPFHCLARVARPPRSAGGEKIRAAHRCVLRIDPEPSGERRRVKFNLRIAPAAKQTPFGVTQRLTATRITTRTWCEFGPPSRRVGDAGLTLGLPGLEIG